MRRYLFTVVLVAGLLLGTVGAFNFMVDPFLLFHHRDGNAAQLSRIDQFYNMRLYKPYHIRRIRPVNVIIGTSRSADIRPHYPAWNGQPSYNFSMPGMTLYEMDQLVKHAQAVHPLSTLVVGLDYQAFVRASPLYRPGFADARLLRHPGDIYFPRLIGQELLDLHAFLFSTDITADSVQASFPQGKIPREYFTDGAWESTNRFLLGRGGYIFVARSAVTSVVRNDLRPEANFPYYRDLLHFCYANHIDAKLFLTPTHVFFVDLWFELGGEQLWRETHQQIVAINEEIAAEYGRQPMPIWGFGDTPGVVAEPILRARESDRAWFRDGTHYGPRLGRRILSALLGGGDDFGHILTGANIGDYLDRVDAIRENFLQSNREQVAALHRAIGDAGALPGQATSE